MALGAQCTPVRLGGCTYTGSSGGVARRGMQAQIFLGHCNGRDSVGDHIFFFDGGQEKEVVVTDESWAEVFRFSSTVNYIEGAARASAARGPVPLVDRPLEPRDHRRPSRPRRRVPHGA
jgi:hypothetical protein